MITLILNADDFGYSRGVSFGIVDAYKRGVVTSTTMMMNMPGTENAIELAKENPGLGVGIHLVLTCGAPLTHRLQPKTIVNSEGKFFKNPDELLKHNVDVSEIETEWRTQIEKFYRNGLVPTHLDSHHHVHTYPGVREVIEKLALEYGLPVRTYPEIKQVKPFSDVLNVEFYGETATHETLDKIVKNASEGQVIEVMTHPAYIDNVIMNGSSYWKERLQELDVLTSWEVPSGVRLYRKK